MLNIFWGNLALNQEQQENPITPTDQIQNTLYNLCFNQ